MSVDTDPYEHLNPKAKAEKEIEKLPDEVRYGHSKTEDRMFLNFMTHFFTDALYISRYDTIDKGLLAVWLIDGKKAIYDDYNETIRTFDTGYKIDTDEKWKKEFAIRLKRQMGIKGISQVELSEITGISQSTLSGYLLRRSVPTIINVMKICNALDYNIVHFTDFYEG